MAWAVRSRHLGEVAAVRPLGRAQLLRLRTVAGGRNGLSIVGHHAPHDDDALVSHIADLSTLAADARGSSAWLIVGDGNADFAAGGVGDERVDAAAAGRAWDRCAAYSRFAATLGASVIVPRCHDSPGGRWAADCLAAPYTRLPRGAEVARPSCLDVIAPRRSCAEAHVLWRLAVDDHAALVVTAAAPRRRPAARWRPRSPGAFRESVARLVEALPPFSPLSRFRSAVRAQMRGHADLRSAAVRRRARVPFVARHALSRAARAATETERTEHRRVARVAIVTEARRRRQAAVHAVAGRGGNVAPKQALHDLAGVSLGDGTVVSDTSAVGDLILAHFSRKWGVGDPDAHERVVVTQAALGGAAVVVGRPHHRGPCGSAASHARQCPRRLRIGVTARRGGRSGSRGGRLHRRAHAARSRPHGCFRQKSSAPSVNKIRILLPHGVVATAIDVLLAEVVHKHVDGLPEVPGFLEGTVAGASRSASSIAHFARIFIDKLCDTASCGALVQSDIQADVRHQLAPDILVRACGTEGGALSGRTAGALTGSRLAGALGRVVVRSAALHLWAARSAAAVSFGHGPPMLLATYVDNIVILGRDASGAEASLAEFMAFFSHAWRLNLPADSTEIMVPRGAPIRPSGAHAVVERMRFLGHVLVSGGSVKPCWRNARGQVCARAQAAMKVARRAHVPLHDRMRALDCVLWLALLSRAPTWPPHSSSLAIEVAPYPLEDPAAFRRRRGHIAGVAIATSTPWSRRLVEAAVAQLRAFESEAPGHTTWVGELLRYRDRVWMADQRVAHGSASSRAGTMLVRAAPGRVPPRFQEAVVDIAGPVGLYP